MDLGFETVGNATVVCHDRGPVLVTDPWIRGPAYFGSWIHQHEIPDEQLEAIDRSTFVWISHGHPDHLSHESLELLRDKDLLLPDHYGGRIHGELKASGYRVWTLRDGLWTELSDRIRICSVSDVHQDAALLIDVGGHLVVDANDCGDHGGGEFVRRTAARYDDSYLLSLVAYGDADMVHFFDEEGRRVPPPAAQKEPLGPGIAGILEALGIRAYVPFSTLHKYQRADSAWANDLITRPEDMRRGFPEGSGREILPPYARVDLARGDVRPIEPPPTPDVVRPPEEFGDDWSEELTSEEVDRIRDYFAPVEHLRTFLGYVRFRVGGKEHVIDVAPDRFDRGITFETPRASLLTAVEHRIFDDLMIGNFTRTTLHGDWGGRRGTEALYPDFNPFLTKYADNGGAFTAADLGAYFAEYRRRGFFSLGPSPAHREMARALAPYL